MRAILSSLQRWMPGAAVATRRRNVFIALALVVSVTVAKLAVFGVLTVERPEAFVFNDTPTYTEPAFSILEDGSFSTDGKPELARTPGYPLFLVPILAATGESLWAVPIQIILAVLVGIGTLLIVQSVAGGDDVKKAGLIALLIVVVDPAFLVSQFQILSETLFTLMLAASFCLIAWFLRGPRRQWTLVGGMIMLGLSAYVRPASMYLGYGLLLILLIASVRSLSASRGHVIRAVALGFAVYTATLGAWFVRNKVKADMVAFSSVSSAQIYENLAAAGVARAEDRNFQDVREEFREEIYRRFDTEAERATYSRQEGLRLIKKYPGEVASIMAKGVIGNAADPGTGQIANMLGLRERGSGLLGRFYDMGPVEFGRHLWEHERALVILLSLGGVWIVFLWATALVGAWSRRKDWSVIDTVMAATVLYTLVISAGPAGQSRYRVPGVPMIAYFAAFGVVYLWTEWRTGR